MNRPRVRALLVIVVACSGPVQAATPAAEMSQDTANTDEITANLERRNRLEFEFRSWREPQWLADYRKAREEWFERIGLNIAASYDIAGLTAWGGADDVTGFSGDFTVQGTWELLGRRLNAPLDLRFRMRQRHAIGGRAASEVASDSGGLFWSLIDGFTNAGFEIPDFQLVQHLPRLDLEVRYGQMTIDSQFDRHALRSSKQAFFNRAFASNPAVAFPRFGAGVTLVWKPDWFDLSIGGSNVQGTQNGDQVDFDLGSGEFFTALQIGHDFEIRGNPSRIQAMAWHSDPIKVTGTPEGKGVSLTFEHRLAESGTRMFARLAWSDGEATDADRLIAAGFAVPHRENNLFGVAAGLGRDGAGSDKWQTVAETFYRWQVGPNLQLSPEAQLVFGGGLRPDHPFRLVLGVRGELAF